MSTTTQAYLQAPTPKASTTSVISNSALNLNWLLRFAGYAGALPPTYTAPPTASSHIAGMETAEAVAAAVADIVDGVAAGQYQSPDARIVTAADALASSMGGAEGSVAAATGGGGFSWGSRGNRGFRGVGSVFNYLTSSWALLCIFMAILLNRTLLYASLRRPTRLPWHFRLLIRVLPITLFILHIRSILYALRCQTSPYLPLDQYPLAATIPYNFNEDRGGFLYTLSRILTPWFPSLESDVPVCQAFGMLPTPGTVSGDPFTPTGSLTILWPLYRTISISLFLSTFSHAIQGPTLAGAAIPSTSSDTGLTLLEDSLAFAEAEALVDPQSGNVSPEVLYIALISALAHLTANIIGVLVADQPGGVRVARGVATVGHYRLITTGIWGVAFLGGFTWALFRGGAKVFGFPTVCVLGFIPHLMVVAGIALCGAIYLLAAIFSTLAPIQRPVEGLYDTDDELFVPIPPQFDGVAGSSTPRGYLDFSNLQANFTLSSLTISWSEDFYTTLLKLGFQCLTAASEATYLNEGAPLRVPGLTWLEKERIRVLERQRKWMSEKAALDRGGGDLEVAMLTSYGFGKRGYSNERKEISAWMVGLPVGYGVMREESIDGGGNESMATGRQSRRPKLGSVRGKRWIGALELIRGAVGVLGRWGVRGMLGVGKKIGIVNCRDSPEPPARRDTLEEEEWEDPDMDVQRDDLDQASMQILGEKWADRKRDEADRRRLWEAFVQARVLAGEEDDSGEYKPRSRGRSREGSPSMDSDTGSLVTSSSFPSTDSLSTSSPDCCRSGSVTPTPTSCAQARATPLSLDGTDEDTDADADIVTDATSQLVHLAALLDPQTPEERSLARVMSQHLSAPPGRHVTRASMTMYGPANNEEFLLESLLLEKRRKWRLGGDIAAATATPSRTSIGVDEVPQGEQQGEDQASWGPCVVCQTNPRTVVVWPCRCLALCEECKVTLAMRNFGTCVCCRREVGAVSRVFAV